MDDGKFECREYLDLHVLHHALNRRKADWLLLVIRHVACLKLCRAGSLGRYIHVLLLAEVPPDLRVPAYSVVAKSFWLWPPHLTSPHMHRDALVYTWSIHDSAIKIARSSSIFQFAGEFHQSWRHLDCIIGRPCILIARLPPLTTTYSRSN